MSLIMPSECWIITSVAITSVLRPAGFTELADQQQINATGLFLVGSRSSSEIKNYFPLGANKESEQCKHFPANKVDSNDVCLQTFFCICLK